MDIFLLIVSCAVILYIIVRVAIGSFRVIKNPYDVPVEAEKPNVKTQPIDVTVGDMILYDMQQHDAVHKIGDIDF